MARKDGKTKKEWLAEEVAKAVGAGKAVAVETVDFSDPNKPPKPLQPLEELCQALLLSPEFSVLE